MLSKDKSVQTLLLDLGFDGADARVYESVLNLESVSVRRAAEATGINRGTTYEAMKRLVSAGLLSTYQKGHREYFVAESPEVLHAIIQEKKRDLLDSEKLAQQLVPELLANRPQTTGKSLVRFFEDDEGIVSILKDVLTTASNLDNPQYYVYSSRQLRSYLYRKFPQFTERRIKLKIFVNVIAIGEGGDPEALSERKWLPTLEAGPKGSYTIVYGDKVAHISLANTFMPYGVVIEDASIATMQRLQFDQLWKSL